MVMLLVVKLQMTTVWILTRMGLFVKIQVHTLGFLVYQSVSNQTVNIVLCPLIPPRVCAKGVLCNEALLL